jgi:hypothetical protein
VSIDLKLTIPQADSQRVNLARSLLAVRLFVLVPPSLEPAATVLPSLLESILTIFETLLTELAAKLSATLASSLNKDKQT